MRQRAGAAPSHRTLSDREFQVPKGVAGGETLKPIAGRMGVSPKTVTTYRARVLEKLGLRGSAELVRYAHKHQLVGTGELPFTSSDRV